MPSGTSLTTPRRFFAAEFMFATLALVGQTQLPGGLPLDKSTPAWQRVRLSFDM